MKSVTKFKTFEELKSQEKGAVNYASSKKKHDAFEEFIKTVKTYPKVNGQSQ
ncbi:hypothetical protein [Mucilaginibacter psychrotolerans]|uniref:hypothetical protein n=1 Tax=Mucilaginibacter psychrotolerans TaxID=1524096 RepID=UPI0013053BD1|nr:hypothetical protein [Mucilaginibacter psychrotolerans]